MQRDTRLDGLPLLTVIVLCTLLVAWMARDGGSSRQVLAGGPGALAGPPDVAHLDALGAPSSAPWGARTVGELLETVLDPSSLRSGRVPVVPASEALRAGPGSVPGPRAPRPFTLAGVDGIVLAEGVLVDGLPEGVWVFRHPDGELRARGGFVAGIPDGLWQSWHEDGQPRARLSYAQGVALGQRTDWWPNGAKALEGGYLDGLREGPWHTWHDNGRLRWEGGYRDGLREGLWREYHPNGALASEATYVEGRRESSFRAWYPDRRLAQEGCYVQGRREGLWAFFTPDGGRDPRSGHYVAGVLQRQ